MTAVAIHVSDLLTGPLVRLPITARVEPRMTINTISGGATSPLMIAVTYRARIGLMPTRLMASPATVARARIA